MKGIVVIKKLSNVLAQHSLITTYKAIVRFHLDYGDILYDQPNNESLCQEIESMVMGGNYYANCKKFVLPSSLFMLGLRAGCHSQLKMVSKKLQQIFWPSRTASDDYSQISLRKNYTPKLLVFTLT